MDFKKFCELEFLNNLSEYDLVTLYEFYSSDSECAKENILSYAKEYNLDYNNIKTIILTYINNKLNK